MAVVLARIAVVHEGPLVVGDDRHFARVVIVVKRVAAKGKVAQHAAKRLFKVVSGKDVFGLAIGQHRLVDPDGLEKLVKAVRETELCLKDGVEIQIDPLILGDGEKRMNDKARDPVNYCIDKAGSSTKLGKYLEQFRGKTHFSVETMVDHIGKGKGDLNKEELLILMVDQLVKPEL